MYSLDLIYRIGVGTENCSLPGDGIGREYQRMYYVLPQQTSVQYVDMFCFIHRCGSKHHFRKVGRVKKIYDNQPLFIN